MTTQLAVSSALHGHAAANDVQPAVKAAYWRPSSREPEGMLWQCRMGDRKGGDIRPALLRLEPLLLRLLLPLWWSWHASHPSGWVGVQVLVPVQTAMQPNKDALCTANQT